MRYTLDIQPTAHRDLRSLSPEIARRVVSKLALLEDDLGGDVKRLTRHTPAYRVRVGDYRVLFDIVGPTVVVQRVIHRSKAYD